MKPLAGMADIRVSNVDKKTSPAEKPVKLCNYMDVYSNIYVTGERDFMDASASRSEIDRFTVKRGDVLITKDSETPDDIGIPAVIVDDIANLVCGYHLALIRPHPQELDSVFLAKQLATARAARFFGQRATGSTRYGLPRSAIGSVTIPAPLKPEQERIAEILLTVDRAIEQTADLIAKRRRIRAGLIEDLLTLGIDGDGRVRSNATHRFKDSRLGRIPIEWDVTVFGDAVASATDGPFGSNLKSGHYVPEPGVRVLRLGNIGTGEFLDGDKAYVSVEHARSLGRHAVAFGDLLVASLGDEKRPFGRACLYPHRSQEAIVKADVFRIRCRPEKYVHPFAVHLFNHPRWRAGLFALAQGVTRDRVNLTNLLRLELPKPPIDEQRVAGAMIDAAIESVIQSERTLLKLEALSAGLQQDLLTGRKRVTPLLKEEASDPERVA
jgi:type I restriction enzyme S subunit